MPPDLPIAQVECILQNRDHAIQRLQDAILAKETVVQHLHGLLVASQAEQQRLQEAITLRTSQLEQKHCDLLASQELARNLNAQLLELDGIMRGLAAALQSRSGPVDKPAGGG